MIHHRTDNLTVRAWHIAERESFNRISHNYTEFFEDILERDQKYLYELTWSLEEEEETKNG